MIEILAYLFLLILAFTLLVALLANSGQVLQVQSGPIIFLQLFLNLVCFLLLFSNLVCFLLLFLNLVCFLHPILVTHGLVLANPLEPAGAATGLVFRLSKLARGVQGRLRLLGRNWSKFEPAFCLKGVETFRRAAPKGLRGRGEDDLGSVGGGVETT